MSTFAPTDYDVIADGSRQSADVIVPIVYDLITPASVIDVGCGVGTWLAACQAHGITDYLGLDGEGASAALQIPAERFRVADLTQPFNVGRRFDLAMSLEVAEHLPPEAADAFVRELTQLAPAVLFSAAIPGQGGNRHLNERWQSYWSGLFAAHGFAPVDVIRPRIWGNPKVEYWYQQNIALYMHHETIPHGWPLVGMLDIVHPALFTVHTNRPLQRLRRRVRRWLDNY